MKKAVILLGALCLLVLGAVTGCSGPGAGGGRGNHPEP